MSNLKKELPIGLKYKNGGGQKGSALYLSIIVLVILLAIVLGLTAILISQMRMVRQMGYSVLALSAADAGIENVLVDWESPSSDPHHYDGFLDNEAEYTVSVIVGGDSGCIHPLDPDKWNFCITSVGEYRGVRRAIEIAY